MSFEEACIKETATNPWGILIYGLSTNDTMKTPLRDEEWNKWFGYLERTIFLWQMDELAKDETKTDLVKVARHGFFKDHGVIICRDKYSRDFVVNRAEKVEDDDGKPGVNGQLIKAWPMSNENG